MTDYQELQDAITKVRAAAPFSDPPIVGQTLGELLQAILDRHVVAVDGNCGNCCHYRWPCPDVLTVETALRTMGALNE